MAMASTMLMVSGLMAVVLLGVVVNGKGSTHSGVLSQSDRSISLSAARTRSVGTFNVADAGVAFALQWLSNQSTPPKNTAAFAPPLWGGATVNNRTVVPFPTSEDANSKFSVVLYPQQGNDDRLKRFLIESVGTCRGQSQILQVCVQLKSFGHYAFFNNKGNGGFWSSKNRSFDGPVHFNGGTNIGLQWEENTPPMFKYAGSDAYTIVHSSVIWKNGSTGLSVAPSTPAQWASVSMGGAPSIQANATSIPFPTASKTQLIAAFGLTGYDDATALVKLAEVEAVAKAKIGVTVPAEGSDPQGGIYVNGDVQQVALSVENAVNQWVTIEQTVPATDDDEDDGYKLVTTIKLNAGTGQTIVRERKYLSANDDDDDDDAAAEVVYAAAASQDTTTTYAGLPNGVIYFNGNIGFQGSATPVLPKRGGLAGEVADKTALTIATGADKNVNIVGDIVYHTKRQKAIDGDTFKPVEDDDFFAANAGVLGIVSRTVHVLDTNRAGAPLVSSKADPVEVHAAVFAYNTYEAYNWTTRAKGYILNMGSYCINNGAHWGTIDAFGNVTKGLYVDRRYDPRLKYSPPPYYPTTGRDYMVVSWQRVAQTLQ